MSILYPHVEIPVQRSQPRRRYPTASEQICGFFRRGDILLILAILAGLLLIVASFYLPKGSQLSRF